MADRPVFIFWDNSNIFISAKDVAAIREGGDARYHVRVSFENILRLAHADRAVAEAIAVGSIPPEMRHVWNRLEKSGVKIELFERGSISDREQAVDQALQVKMLRAAFDNNGHPGIAVMMTGDGRGFMDGVGFHADLDRMRRRGWGVEVLAWEESCNPRLRKWAEQVGVFVPLENFYDSVTFTEDSNGVIRRASRIDLSRRPYSTH